jgi:hypothetical protein
MKIAYLTTDVVNPALARRWAKPLGGRVLTPRPSNPSAGADAVVIDFDHLPGELQRKAVNAVLLRTELRPVLVHGHNIPERLAEALRLRGAVAVVGRLDRRTVRRWVRKVARRVAVAA